MRTARLRRNLTIKEVAEKIGTGRRAGRHAIEAQRGDLIAISAISGDTTTVRLSVAKAGSWQHIDLPEPVGITAGTLSPVRT
ncbi:MAG: hypothetical protein F4X97_01805 [Boseongicola sp. SB0662_bin_57]|nr:hypothetical protein [Boseongicola sp. SB0662_bin_57]